jgi:ribosomal protein S18 acetylase RimI-like enzyme
MEFRKFDQKHDDLNKVVELIIETEPSFFYLIFGKNKLRSFSRLKKLVEAGKNSFGYEFIRLAIEKNKILGITIFYIGNEIDKKVESKIFSKSIDFLGLIRINFFAKTLLKKILTTKLGEKDLYISNMCIEKNHRGKGVGTFLFEKIIEYAKIKKCKNIILDVSKENTIGINLYKKMGFKIIRERSSLIWKISIYQMIKKL